jgi:hypothetical protein
MKEQLSKSARSRPGASALINAIYCIALPCLFAIIAFQPASDANKEYKLKAAFLYNFIQYIEWPPAQSNEYIVGIIGSSPIEQPLKEIALTRPANDKKIVVRHFNSADEISYCNILFIARDMAPSLNEILAKTPKGTLTVSEKPGYARQGTAINFVVVDNKLKFESNLKALNACGLKASSQLLKLAILVD